MAAPFPEMYDATDSATVSAPITASVNAGNALAAVEYRLWNDKGATHSSTTLNDARLRVVAYDGTNKISSGLPALDEGWVEVRLIGQNTTGDPAMLVQTSPWTKLGTDRALWLSPIPANCARHFEVKITVPSGAANNVQEIYLELVYDEFSIVLGRHVSLATGGGIIPDRFDVSLRRLTSGGRFSGFTGAETFTVEDRTYVYDGTPYTVLQTVVTLNQTSGSGALAAGESYIAIISQAAGSATPTTTKGNRAVTPVAPATPTGEIFLGKVTVTYQAGGTSVINSGNADLTAVLYGEFIAINQGTSTLKIGAGRAITGTDTEITHTANSSVALASDSGFFVWLNSDGTFTTTVGDTPPDNSIYIASGVTISGVIISLSTFNKPRAERAITEYTLELRHHGSQSVAADLAWGIGPPWLSVLESVRVEHGVPSSGGTGTTIYDINTRPSGGSLATPGTTIYTSQGTVDRRPSIAVGATVSFAQSPDLVNEHEVVTCNPSIRFSLDCDAVTTGTVAVDVIAVLTFRRRR